MGSHQGGVQGSFAGEFGGDNLTHAKLPDEIAKFTALNQVKEISSEARKIFIGLLVACVYSWLAIGTTTDLALILNTVSSPLPIINTPVPIADFYWVGSTILAAVYCYLHFYLLRLWQTLATLPAIFPDGTPLDDKIDPWLLAGLVRTYMPHIPLRPLGYVENGISVLLAWVLVPITLFFYWRGLLPSHDLDRLAVLAFLIAFTSIIGWHTFFLARATLRRQVPPGNRARTLLCGIWRDFRFSLGQIAAFCLLAGTVMGLSIVGLHQSPRDADTSSVVVFSVSAPWQSLREVDATPAKLLNFVGIRTYADLREAKVAARPDGWDSKDWSKVRQVDLRGRDLAFVDGRRAFLSNVDLRGVELRGADLRGAELQGADLRGARLQSADLRQAQLQDANLEEAGLDDALLQGAQLQDARLAGTRLRGVDLAGANFNRANLFGVQLQGSLLYNAQLQDTDLEQAHLQGAELRGATLDGSNLLAAHLQGADLLDARLRGARLYAALLHGAELQGAQFQGADLRGARLHGADLQGADLRGAGLWRAIVTADAEAWSMADLRGSDAKQLWFDRQRQTDLPDRQISDEARSIPEPRRGATVQRLRRELLSKARPSRPQFPDLWRSAPNVMFEPGDPAPQPFEWGPRKWATERGYDEDLAEFLGDLACGGDVSEAQARGLVGRALHDGSDRFWPILFAKRVTGPDCSPAKGLRDDMRRRLEQLAARGDATAASAEASEPDPVE